MVKANSLKEICDGCHSTKSKEFWSFEEDEDEIVLCDTCYEEYKDELHKAIADQSKLVFIDSAGWLLFWLIVCPPVGYIWLIFGMEKGEVNLMNVLKRIKHNKQSNDKITISKKKTNKKEIIIVFSVLAILMLIILLVALLWK